MPGAKGAGARAAGSTRRRLAGGRSGAPVGRRGRKTGAEDFLDRLAVDGAGPQQHRAVEAGDDGGFDAERGGAVIDEELDAVTEVVEHVLGRRRRDLAGPVRRRRHHRLAERGEDLLGDRMARHPNRDGVEPGGREQADRAVRCLRQDQSQGPRPERAGELQRGVVEHREALGGGEIGHVGDQRIERRPFLDRIELRHRLVVGRVGAEAIDGLGREGNEPARRQHAPCVLDRADTCPRHAGHQAGHRKSPHWVRSVPAYAAASPRAQQGRAGSLFAARHPQFCAPVV